MEGIMWKFLITLSFLPLLIVFVNHFFPGWYFKWFKN